MEDRLSNEFYDLIVDTSRSTFEAAISQYGSSSLCAFALYSDEGAMTVLPSINAESHLKKMIASDPDDPFYYRWSPAEWKFEAIDAEKFAPISVRLQQELRKVPEDDLEGFCSDIYEICVRVLGSVDIREAKEIPITLPV